MIYTLFLLSCLFKYLAYPSDSVMSISCVHELCSIIFDVFLICENNLMIHVNMTSEILDAFRILMHDTQGPEPHELLFSKFKLPCT